MSIRQMLASITILIALGLATLMLSTQALVLKIEHSIEASRYVAELKANMLMLRKNEKDFLTRKELKYQDQYESNYRALITSLSILDDKLSQADIEFGSLSQLTGAFEQYKEGFHKLVAIQQQLGLDET
ncbi:hypothetical protein [Vibrio sp. HN007]|uniref:hypothetical protein n=1 Tax=Vibrio iocasae TaxID=3098914 RepID=UPI0035D50B08